MTEWAHSWNWRPAGFTFPHQCNQSCTVHPNQDQPSSLSQCQCSLFAPFILWCEWRQNLLLGWSVSGSQLRLGCWCSWWTGLWFVAPQLIPLACSSSQPRLSAIFISSFEWRQSTHTPVIFTFYVSVFQLCLFCLFFWRQNVNTESSFSCISTVLKPNPWRIQGCFGQWFSEEISGFEFFFWIGNGTNLIRELRNTFCFFVFCQALNVLLFF